MSEAAVDRVVETICPFCGVGCGLGLRVASGRVGAVEPLASHPVSHGQLCSKGWNAAFAIDPADRIRTPLVKEAGDFRPATWDEALSLMVEAFRDVSSMKGADALGVISCARATNEDNYAAQKFARAVLGTNNVDHCARICHSPSVAGLGQTLGSGAMTNSIEDVEKADLLVVWGCDPTESHPILGSRILEAKLSGKKLLVVDPRRTRLAQVADLHLSPRLGTNVALANSLLYVIFENEWENKEFLATRTENEKALREKVREYPPEKVAEICGVPAEKIVDAAQLYARSKAAFLAYGMGITQYHTGTNNVMALSNLVLAAGQVGRPGTGINPLRGQNNVQGACDMGALPDVFPGYQKVSDPKAREKFSKAWGRPLPDRPGRTSLGLTEGALTGDTKCLIVLGEDPVLTDPDQNHVERALKALDLLVVSELVMTETAKLADVILPAASFAEKDGTFTNCERRVQRVRAAVPPPGEARGDWQMLAELSRRLAGYEGLSWKNAESVFGEMAALTPIYSAMTYPRLAGKGLQWPCDAAHPEGSPILHAKEFPIGRARLVPLTHQDPAELPDKEYPFALTTQRLHYHYGCGSMTRKSPLLERETPDGVLFMNAEDGKRLGLRDHAGVRVVSRRGELETRVVFHEDVPPGLLSMPYNFKEAPANQLTNNVQDPVTRMPELKACAVRVEALPTDAAPRSREVLREGVQ
ncbi:MAG: formate dehydrogenase subunit alpha [Bdellovibrionota bacterium]